MKASLKTIVFYAAISGTSWSQALTPQHFAISVGYVAHAVVRAFSEDGVQIGDGQVSLLTNVVATESDPALDVSIEPFGNQLVDHLKGTRSTVRVECHVQGVCVPFYVLVTLPDTTKHGKLRKNLSENFESVVAKPKQSTMRLGDHATLLLDDDRAQIEISVVSLQNGMAGQTIRVSSLDHKQLYFAEVVSATLVKGRF
jgi:hypothetical protein